MNAFTTRIAPIKPFTAQQQARVLRALPSKPHPFARIQIEPAKALQQDAVKRFGMRKAAI